MANTALPLNVYSTQTIAATSTTAQVALGTAGNGSTLQVVNLGPNIAFVNVGTDNTVTASATFPTASLPVPAGAIMSYTVRADFTNVAAVCLSAQTATLYISRGDGV